MFGVETRRLRAEHHYAFIVYRGCGPKGFGNFNSLATGLVWPVLRLLFRHRRRDAPQHTSVVASQESHYLQISLVFNDFACYVSFVNLNCFVKLAPTCLPVHFLIILSKCFCAHIYSWFKCVEEQDQHEAESLHALNTGFLLDLWKSLCAIYVLCM